MIGSTVLLRDATGGYAVFVVLERHTIYPAGRS
jgi:hypothetical protein